MRTARAALVVIAVIAALAVLYVAWTIWFVPDISDSHPGTPKIGVVPAVTGIERVDAGEYNLNLGAEIGRLDTNHPVDVTVTGYNLTGSRTCRVVFRNVTVSRPNRSVTCDGFPALLLTDVSLTSNRTNGSNLPGYHRITKRDALYKGYANGSHHFENQLLSRESINTRTFREANCLQWRDGGNYSAISSPPWRDWTRQPPEVNRYYKLIAFNRTHLKYLDQEKSLSFEYTYDAEKLPLWYRGLLDEGFVRGNNWIINQSRFYSLVEALSGRRPRNLSELPPALAAIKGDSGSYENIRIICHEWPPRYTHYGQISGLECGDAGYRGQYAAFLVRHKNTIYRAKVKTERCEGGPAITNTSTLNIQIEGKRR